MTVLGAVLAGLLLGQAVSPAAPPSRDEGAAVEGVEVTGKRLTQKERDAAVSEFVRELSEPTQRKRLARWDVGVCPGVVGLPQKQAVYLADRIAEEALAVGLEVGAPGCRPDVLILVTDNAGRAATQFHERYPQYFVPALRQSRLEAGEGRKRLASFLGAERPIRSWHVSKLASTDGRPIVFAPYPIFYNARGSRLASNWKNDLSRVLIIVDTTRLKGVSYEQLASYLAMATLAQIDLEAEGGPLSSIIAMFADREAGRAPPETMTPWDRAYLRGLYAASDDSRSLHTQRGAIRRSLKQAADGR